MILAKGRKDESVPCFFSEASFPAVAYKLEGIFHLIQMQRKKKTERKWKNPLGLESKEPGKTQMRLEICLRIDDIPLLKIRPSTVQWCQ